ncbi:hypothetical protein R3P38DRAFT_2497804 [Favolaschia claudopus]|uniref:Uncharacterized protein n=1 Tax=Favolaschia claudopus TaxID=2862362 RepID=A0AAW0E0H1_9AGAR
MEPLLAYRKATLWLLAVYLPTLVVPWVLICVLDFHPLNVPSYDNQRGNIPPHGLLVIYTVVALVRILNSISGILVMPVVGGILAHAAVVFSQRRKANQRLNLLQLLTLADRGWGSFPIMWTACSRGASSSFLWLAALMTVLSIIQQPIQSAFVTFEPLIVMSCADLPQDGRCVKDSAIIAAYDAEPRLINLLSHNLIVSSVAADMITLSDLDQISNLWVDDPYASSTSSGFTKQPDHGMFFWFARNGVNTKERYFASALQNGTTTGVLRQHALRMNSSVSCEVIAKDDFPSTCGGAGPVHAAYSNQFIDVRVCAPGEAGVTPWKPTRNREDISEELYIDMQLSDKLYTFYAARNFTRKCTAGSTKGYFELGNNKNDYVYGPLIDKWPSPDELENNFNDYLTTNDSPRPTVEDPIPDRDDIDLLTHDLPDPTGTRGFNVSGPLMTAASALFGNNSFLDVADPHNNLTSAQVLQLMCRHGGIPFSLSMHLGVGEDFHVYCSEFRIEHNSPSTTNSDGDLAMAIGMWFFKRFNDPDIAEYMLDISMFLANRAVLNKAVTISQGSLKRPIYTSPGLVLVKPTKSLAGTVLVSLLIGLQLVGMGLLMAYIYSVPTWTRSLDALAVARIGGEVPAGEMPPLGPLTKEDERRMRRVDGLIGVRTDLEFDDVEGGRTRRGSETSVALMGKEVDGSEVELVLGGRGIVTRRLL